jgi:hypothetical protein
MCAPALSSLKPMLTRLSILSRFLPSSFAASTNGRFPPWPRSARSLLLPGQNVGFFCSDFSSVWLSILFTVGKLIDNFTCTNPVGRSPDAPSSTLAMSSNCVSIVYPHPQTIPYGFSLTQATAGLLLVFTMRGAYNAGRAFLMRMSGASCFHPPKRGSHPLSRPTNSYSPA